jgi:hypothetical protein
MQLFWRYDFRLQRAITTQVAFEHVCRQLGEDAGDDGRLLLVDSPKGRISAVGRLTRRFPFLRKFEYQTKGHPALSNLRRHWAEAHPSGDMPAIPLARVAQIARGIPKAHPLLYASFVFDALPWAALDNGAARRASSRPPSAIHPGATDPRQHPGFTGVVLTSHWWTSGRRIHLMAIVPVRHLDWASTEVPEPDAEARRRLQQLGTIGYAEPLVALGTDGSLLETADRNAKLLRDQFIADLPHIMRRLPGIASLPPQPAPPIRAGKASSHKLALIDALQPLGYRYEGSHSGHGVFVLRKATAKGNVVDLHFDVGSWWHACTCTMGIAGPGWFTSFPLLATPVQVNAQYPITDDAAWGQIVGNYTVVAREVESALVPTIEDLYPTPPAWWPSACMKAGRVSRESRAQSE